MQRCFADVYPLLAFDNVMLTPHTPGSTWESCPPRYDNAYANIARVSRGAPPRWIIPALLT